MRIVIVGATGNLGTAVLRRFSAEGPSVDLVGIARRIPDTSTEPYAGVEWHSIDVGDDASTARLAEVFAEADAVVHLAWALQPNHDERAMWSTNVAGTARMLEAVALAGVDHVVVASSVGAYSGAPKTGRQDESWPTGGLHTSHYSRFKALNERALDRFEQRHPHVIVSRMRPGLVFQNGVASQLTRLFLGSVVPTGWMGRVPLPFLPLPPQLVSQVVHADDLADAFWRAVERRAGGPFNIAAEPVIDPPAVAHALKARRVVPLSLRALRRLVRLTWMARIQPTDPGWIDIASNAPIMSTERARLVLGWVPRVSALAALDEMVRGVSRDDATPGSTPLER